MCHPRNSEETTRPHVCGRDCDYDPDRGCPIGDAEHFPERPSIIEAEMEQELAYLRSKIAYLERRDGIR
jgi:hypothetical protein